MSYIQILDWVVNCFVSSLTCVNGEGVEVPSSKFHEDYIILVRMDGFELRGEEDGVELFIVVR